MKNTKIWLFLLFIFFLYLSLLIQEHNKIYNKQEEMNPRYILIALDSLDNNYFAGEIYKIGEKGYDIVIVKRGNKLFNKIYKV